MVRILQNQRGLKYRDMTTIILILLLAIGILLLRQYDWETLGITIVTPVTIILIIHVFGLLLAPYSYNVFVEKRNAFEQTLKDARENANDLERAAIIQNVSQWNIELAEKKYNNTTFILSPYIDDRIMDLEPIK
jgi:cell division protein FtsW (lipid II flippase)